MHHVVGGKWGMLIRRLCEAGARTLPFMGLLLIPVLFGMGTLYVWARPEAYARCEYSEQGSLSECPVFHCPRSNLLLDLVLVLATC